MRTTLEINEWSQNSAKEDMNQITDNVRLWHGKGKKRETSLIATIVIFLKC